MWKLTYHTELSSILLVLTEISHKLIWKNFLWIFLTANLIRFSWMCENFSHLLFIRQGKFSWMWNEKKFLTKFFWFHKCEIRNNFLWENFHLMTTLLCFIKNWWKNFKILICNFFISILIDFHVKKNYWWN